MSFPFLPCLNYYNNFHCNCFNRPFACKNWIVKFQNDFYFSFKQTNGRQLKKMRGLNYDCHSIRNIDLLLILFNLTCQCTLKTMCILCHQLLFSFNPILHLQDSKLCLRKCLKLWPRFESPLVIRHLKNKRQDRKIKLLSVSTFLGSVFEQLSSNHDHFGVVSSFKS